jgi:pSer/pThr/pTyr-binding forkhead associated (FHA) protein
MALAQGEGMANPLRKIEIQFENLFEKRTGILSAHTVHAGKILARLIETLEESAQPGPDGRWIAPNIFRLSLGKRIWQTVSNLPDLKELLVSKLDAHIQQSEMILRNPIQIEWEMDSSLREESIRAKAEIFRSGEERTDAFQPTTYRGVLLPRGAFLIVNGRRHVTLNRPVVNIGRQLDNHIVLDDVLVSRRHAQLRAREGQYLLTDLGSKHGIRVNNIVVREWMLQPGDVFRLGNTELIYGDEREESITQPIRPESPAPSPDNPSVPPTDPEREAG